MEAFDAPGPVTARLPRPYQLHLVLALMQPGYEATERHGDAVHLGRISFRDDRYPEGLPTDRKLLENDRVRAHPPSLAVGRETTMTEA